LRHVHHCERFRITVGSEYQDDPGGQQVYPGGAYRDLKQHPGDRDMRGGTAMTDYLDYLRWIAKEIESGDDEWMGINKNTVPDFRGAADEIEKLRGENEKARKLIRRLRSRVVELKAERDAAVKDAERYRYLRNRDSKTVLETKGPAAGCWIDCETDDELVLLTGDDADAAIDTARSDEALNEMTRLAQDMGLYDEFKGEK
jgi:hypothetical protein